MLDLKKLVAIIWTHAVLATLSWALFFPLGAVLVRVVTKQARNVHWMFQTLGMLCFTVAFGLGAWIATTLNLWVTWNGHAIIGTLIFGLMLMLPILGILHHYDYVSTHNSYKFAWIHVWLGRTLILAGIVNGGLGLQLGYYEVRHESLRQGQIAYGVIAGLIALAWIAVSVFACIRSKGDVNVGGESGQKVQGLGYLRNDSQQTDVSRNAALEKGAFEVADTGSAAPAPASQTQAHASTATTTAATSPANTGGDDIVHGGPHDQTRLANIIDPAVGKSESTNMFA